MILRLKEKSSIWIAAGILVALSFACIVWYPADHLSAGSHSIVQIPTTKQPSKSKTSTRIYSFFSPDGGAERAMIREIGKAKRSIKVAVYFFTEKDFADALIRAKDRGVKVEVIVDRTQENRKDSMVPHLLAEGISLYIDKKHRIMHNKFTVIDNKTVITGSQNWTDSSEKKNAENTLIIHNNRYFAKKYLDAFEQLKDLSVHKQANQHSGEEHALSGTIP